MSLTRVKLFACLAAVLAATSLRAATVDYTTVAAGSKTNPYDTGGVTATGSGTIFTDTSGGLGVVDNTVSAAESVNFAFDAGAASGITLVSDFALFPPPTSGNFALQGFGVGGSSLGTVQVPVLATFPNFNISSLFGNVLLSSFTIGGGSAQNASIAISQINYTPVTVGVTPEPSSLLLLGTGALVLTGSLRRRLSA